jgi:hypothetical protein
MEAMNIAFLPMISDSLPATGAATVRGGEHVRS